MINEIKIDLKLQNIESDAFKNFSSLIQSPILSSLKKIEKIISFKSLNMTKSLTPKKWQILVGNNRRQLLWKEHIAQKYIITIISDKNWKWCLQWMPKIIWNHNRFLIGNDRKQLLQRPYLTQESFNQIICFVNQ